MEQQQKQAPETTTKQKWNKKQQQNTSSCTNIDWYWETTKSENKYIHIPKYNLKWNKTKQNKKDERENVTSTQFSTRPVQKQGKLEVWKPEKIFEKILNKRAWVTLKIPEKCQVSWIQSKATENTEYIP